MAKSYYYLVAGLPDIFLDDEKTVVDFNEIMEEISGSVTPQDNRILEYIRFPYDNNNVINMLTDAGHAFDTRGKFSEEELAAEIKNPDCIPEYMVTFLEQYRENKEVVAGLSLEDQLTYLFFQDALQCDNSFLRAWFSFDCTLRNVLTAIAYRGMEQEDMSRSLEQLIINCNDAAPLILKSNAPDFSLGAEFPWVEKIIGLSTENQTEREKQIDLLRWDLLNDLTTFSYFQIETIVAFCLKALITQRWQQLDADEGKKRLETLVAELKSGFSLHEE